MYRYKDDSGQLVISTTVPQEASKRGYEILNSQGRVIEEIAPAPTAQEIARREAEAERKQQQALQREKDARLLKRYSHPDEAVRALHRKIRELQDLNQLKRGNISVIESQLDTEQSRAADLERSGREVPESTLNRITRLQAQIDALMQEIDAQNREIEALREAYGSDIRRLETVTGNARTLPLEPARKTATDG